MSIAMGRSVCIGFLSVVLSIGYGRQKADKSDLAVPEIEFEKQQSDLIYAIRFHDAKTVEALMKQHIDPNFLYRDEPKDEFVSPLTEAIAERQLRIIALLFENGADPNFGVQKGLVPVAIAAWYDDLDTLKELIKRGANINATTTDGYTPLLMAASTARGVDLIRTLYAAGADVNVKSKNHGSNAIMLSAANLNPSAVDFFIEAGVDPCAKDAEGETAVDYTNVSILTPQQTRELVARREILRQLRKKCGSKAIVGKKGAA